jgi:hypothetical protein
MIYLVALIDEEQEEIAHENRLNRNLRKAQTLAPTVPSAFIILIWMVLESALVRRYQLPADKCQSLIYDARSNKISYHWQSHKTFPCPSRISY